MSCWEKQPLGSQQVVWKGRLIPEKMCTPEEMCLRGGQVGPEGGRPWKWTMATGVPRGHDCAQELGSVNWVTCSCPLLFSPRILLNSEVPLSIPVAAGLFPPSPHSSCTSCLHGLRAW